MARSSYFPNRADRIEISRGWLGSPLLEAEGQGEVGELSEWLPHLTPTLSFQEREPVAPGIEGSGRAKSGPRRRRSPVGASPKRLIRRNSIAPLVLALLPLAACTPRAPAPPGATLRTRIAALALAQADFGAVSVIPVRFEHSRIAGPFEDGGRTLYCVSTRMKGRTLDKGERAKVVIRDTGGVLSVLDDDDEVCSGHRTEPFAELETLGNRS